MNRNVFRRAAISGAVAAAILAVPSCAGSGAAHGAAVTKASVNVPARAITINKQALLFPKQKYFGIFTPGLPENIGPVVGNADSVTSMANKQPNLAMYFQSWADNSYGQPATTNTTNFDSTGAAKACAAGLLPMLTWESWNTSTMDPAGGVAKAQPAFSDAAVIHGKYDGYIKATAKAIAALKCPLALRFDQEENGSWYPWGVVNKNMTGANAPTGHRYNLMWRHVWNIFQAEGATNVLWVWSPNWTPLKSPLAASYPGTKYVDIIAMDGYYFNTPGLTFSTLFNPLIHAIRTIPGATKKPWIIGETGVGGTSVAKTFTPKVTASQEATQMTNLLHAVAGRKYLDGLVYFDQGLGDGSDRADWRFDQNQQTLAAFKKGIASSHFASGKAGSFTSQ